MSRSPSSGYLLLFRTVDGTLREGVADAIVAIPKDLNEPPILSSQRIMPAVALFLVVHRPISLSELFVDGLVSFDVSVTDSARARICAALRIIQQLMPIDYYGR